MIDERDTLRARIDELKAILSENFTAHDLQVLVTRIAELERAGDAMAFDLDLGRGLLPSGPAERWRKLRAEETK